MVSVHPFVWMRCRLASLLPVRLDVDVGNVEGPYLCTEVSCVLIAHFMLSGFEFRKPSFGHGGEDGPQVESTGGGPSNISCERHICAVTS